MANESDGNNTLNDRVFLSIFIVSFLAGILSCFSPRLATTRPLFFGVFLSCLVHKFMGGVDKAEITDLKSAMGNIKLQGPAAAIVITTGGMAALYHYTSDPVVKIDKPKDGEALVILNPDNATPSEVVATYKGYQRSIPSDARYDGLFDLFIDSCILNTKKGCRKNVTIKSDHNIPAGFALLCTESKSPIELPVQIVKESGSKRVKLGAKLLTDQDSDCARGTLMISRVDEEVYRFNTIPGDRGFYRPLVGAPAIKVDPNIKPVSTFDPSIKPISTSRR